jgi:hypothetical protein
MFAEFIKTAESNQQLAKDLATKLTAASVEFTKTLTDVNTRFADTFKAQATEAYKNLESFKFPGFDAYSAKTSKK